MLIIFFITCFLVIGVTYLYRYMIKIGDNHITYHKKFYKFIQQSIYKTIFFAFKKDLVTSTFNKTFFT